MLVRMLPASAVALCVMAGTASAATPFTAGTGGDPSVAVGADGTGHVVWPTPNPTSVGYCRVSAGAQTCNRSELLAFGGSDPQTTGRPVVFTPAPNKVVIVAGCWACGAGGGTENRTFRWVSTNNGTSFDEGPIEIGHRIRTQGAGTWLDAEGIFVGVSSSRVKAAAPTTFEGVQYATGGTFVYTPEVTRVPGTNKLVAVTNDLDVVKYGVFDGDPLTPDGINAVGNWGIDKTLADAEGDNSETTVNAGPNGVYLTYRYFVPNDNRLGLRRFDPATDSFGPPTYVEGTDTIENHGVDYPESFQDPAGRLHVLWRSLYDGGRLRYRVSDRTGANFSAAANLARQESFIDPDMAAGADGKGFAAWTSAGGGGGTVRVVPLDPQPEPGTQPGGGGNPPAGGRAGLPVSFSGRGNELSAKVVGRRVRIRMRGTIRLPAGANVRAACTGKVRLAIKKKRKTLKKTSARLKVRNGRCRFGKTIFIKRSKVGRNTTRLRLKVSFRGNAVLAAGSTTKTLVIKR